MTPNHHQPDDPELHRTLRELPSLRAPEGLIPGVMSAIARRQTAWYRRPATSWPQSLQLAFVAVALLVLGGAVWIALHHLPAFQPVNLQSLFAAPISKLMALSATLEALLNAGSLVGRVAIGPALLIIAAAASVFYLVLFGMGTALWRATRRITN